MDQPDNHHRSPEDPSLATHGTSSSLELGNVRHVLMGKLDTLQSHYTSITLLGKGSFGEVHAAHDTLLGREVAIKSLKQQFRDEEEVVDRFLKEARGTAQLEHPNIMPVHEMGVTDALGVYFTMKKIEGENLKEILDRFEADTVFFLEKYPLNKLLEIFLAVCNGVAFAHSRGVIHRDLKPANIMAGEYGEVLILDWGLVKSLHEKEGAHKGIQLRMEEFDAAENTLDGAISGTPNYMSPEQAEGKIDEIDFQSDIYSLGAILYHILTHLPPFEKTQLRKLLENVKQGRFTRPRLRRPELKIPRELDAICMKAMSRIRKDRYASVEMLAEDIRNYIAHREVSAYKAPHYVRFWNTCRRNPVKASVTAAAALALVLAFSAQFAMDWGSYDDGMENAERHRNLANEKVAEAKIILADLHGLDEREELHQRSDVEKALQVELAEQITEINMLYNLAIGFYDGIPERYRASQAVVDSFAETIYQQIEFALDRKAYNVAQERMEFVMARYESSGIPFTPEKSTYLANVAARIQGSGCLVINAPPNVAGLSVRPLVVDGLRLVEGELIKQDTEFPIGIIPIEEGSYLLTLTLEDGSRLPYPIFIDHAEQMDLVLEVPVEMPEGMVYVPPGTFYFGGPLSRFYRRHENKTSAFFIKQYEVTVREYLEFWKTLGKAEQEACMSRIRLSWEERRYNDAWDADGKVLPPLSLEYPVVGITREAADAYCVWKSERLGRTVQLPSIYQWEKAARGVDGRTYPWGDGYDSSANLALTKKDTAAKAVYPLWAPPGSFPNDVSVYGAYDMGGNVREMTSTPLPDSTDFYQIKGGSASTPDNFLPCSNSSDTPVVPSDVGFRYVMEIPE